MISKKNEGQEPPMLIPIEFGQFVLADTTTKPQQGDWGVGFAVGIKKSDGTEYVGRGWFLFKYDGSEKAKLNALAQNSFKILFASKTLNLDGVPFIEKTKYIR